ncbi:hypothetical protein [Mangrovicoccus ximenensis]|uniref:hypothetical protein n=1 Tax=Mangrovicoccus ximenensis TaxID=1911570 RepID=UPI001F453CEE|nr:hypothetical protein [Mangrovicoccus ximenensis]
MASQTLEQVLAASEMIGGILQYGHKVTLTKLSSAESEEATDIGFSIYSEGPEAVDTIRRTSPATAVQAGPLAYYGRLFDWLDRRANSIRPDP